MARPQRSQLDPKLPTAGPDLFSMALMSAVEQLSPTKARKVKAPPSPYINDPVTWVKHRLDDHLWSKQIEIAEAIVKHRRVAVHSAHQTGKSFLMSRIVAWWLDVHPPGDAFVITTAPTGSQVKAVLWREIRRAHKLGGLQGRTNQTEWWLEDEMVAMGRKPSDYDEAAFQGVHARAVLVIIDEASGVPEGIVRAASSLGANEASRIVAIGNPDDPTSHFARICKMDSSWHVIRVNGLDSPNFTGEWVPEYVSESLIGPTYVQETLEDCGGDTSAPLYVAKVLGLFPENARDAVVLNSWVAQCQALDLPYGTPIELGMDVGAGGDETTIIERRGRKVTRNSWHAQTPNWEDAVELALEAIDATGATKIKVDAIGIGWGVVGRLEQLYNERRHRCEVVPVVVSESPDDPEHFPRLRDQLWWEIGREYSRGLVWDLAHLRQKGIVELTTPTYKRENGRIKIESKDDTRKKIRRSPNDADALLLAFYEGEAYEEFTYAVGGSRDMVTQYQQRVMR